jgi:hypothetical protein
MKDENGKEVKKYFKLAGETHRPGQAEAVTAAVGVSFSATLAP